MVTKREESEDIVDEYVDEGYRITRSSSEENLGNNGPWAIRLILLIFMIGFGNVAHLGYSWVAVDTVAIVLREADTQTRRRKVKPDETRALSGREPRPRRRLRTSRGSGPPPTGRPG